MTDSIVNKIVGFEHVHFHTTIGSHMDGFSLVEEAAERKKHVNQKYLCITDHGMMSAIPSQIKACDKYGLHPVFGCELYVQPGQPSDREVFEKMSPVEKQLIRKSYHLLAIAYNEIGYKNLVQLSSWGWVHGYYYKPRVNHEQLLKHKEGIIFTSCCYNSEIAQAFDKGGEEFGFKMLEKYMAMFGENFFLEIMLLDFKKQKPYDAFIIKCHDKYHLPLLMSNDVHYVYKEDSKYQQYMLMLQKDVTIKDMEKKLSKEDKEDIFELQDTNLWMKSEEELNAKWIEMYSDVIPYDLFVQSKMNSVKICEKARGIKIDRSPKLPQLPNAEDRLKEAVIEGAKKKGLLNSKRHVDQIKEEYELICRKGFASYFLINKMLVDEARRVSPKILGWGNGDEAISAGRGSGVSSLVCYLLGIIQIEPLMHDLLFSRFMSENRGGKSMRLPFSK